MPLVQVGTVGRQKLMSTWLPMAASWGFTAGALVVFAGETIPRLRKDIFSNIPVIGNYYVWQRYREWTYG
ncbi:hypothetical protein MP638_003435 [Amoeboaphelidium occidentale]|nr:hypothetical protein MP638_003435 [Amoeboaphelidium occidentale]